MLAFLQSDVQKKYGAYCTHMWFLCCGKAAQLALDFESPLDSDWWKVLAAPSIDVMLMSIVTLVLVNHSEYSRRVLELCSSFPLSLICMCAEEPAALRKSTAVRLENARPGKLCRTTRKCLAIHRDAVARVARDGAFPTQMCASLAAFRCALASDTQVVESANKTVVHENNKGPHFLSRQHVVLSCKVIVMLRAQRLMERVKSERKHNK